MVMTRQYSFDEQRPLLSRQESSDDHRVPSLSNIQKVPSISDLTDDGKASDFCGDTSLLNYIQLFLI